MSKVILNVVSQHAEEAAMLWLLRNNAVHAPHYDLADLAKLDDRVEAHLDGLRIAGDEGWALCEEQLAVNEVGEVFAAGVMAFESCNEERIEKVLGVVEKETTLGSGLISALGWLTSDQAQLLLQGLLETEEPILQWIGIGGAAVHRRQPGEMLAKALLSEQPLLRARALKAVGELHAKNAKKHEWEVALALRDGDPECRYAAAWSGALLRLPNAIPVLQEIAESESPRAAAAASLAVRCMDPHAANAWLCQLADNPAQLRIALQIAGAIGDPAFIPWIVYFMDQPPLARIAGEAFTSITGVDIAYDDLEGEWPEGFEAGPTENPEDENVEMDADEDLPWPEPALIQNWWSKNQSRFPEGVRHLVGKPITVDQCQEILRTGKQRQRAAAALELTLRRPGLPLFNVKAPGYRQQRVLKPVTGS
jgi:uncharacterized protein (TIGR02270 family)